MFCAHYIHLMSSLHSISLRLKQYKTQAGKSIIVGGAKLAGVVDFNMLQTVLHVLAQQQQILGKYVELSQGVTFQETFDNADRSTISVNEIKIREMGQTRGKEDKDRSTLGTQNQYDDDDEDDTLLIVERVSKPPLAPITEKELVEITKASRDRMKKRPAAKRRTPKPDPTPPPAPKTDFKIEEEKAAVTEKTSLGSRKDGERRLSIVTAQQFTELKGRVNQLQDQVLGSIPKAQEMIEEVRSQKNVKSISEMWQLLNVSARLEAAEAGLEKLSSLMQDLAQEYVTVQKQLKKANPEFKVCVSQRLAALAGLEGRLSDLATEVADLGVRLDSSELQSSQGNSPVGSRGKRSPENDSVQYSEQLDTVRETHKVDRSTLSTKSPEDVETAVSYKSPENVDAASNKSTENMDIAASIFKKNVEKLGKDMKMVQNELKTLRVAFKKFKRQASSRDDGAQHEILDEEVPDNESSENLGNEITALRDQIGTLSQSVEQLVQAKKGGVAGKASGGEGGTLRLSDRPNAYGDIKAISVRLRQLEKRVDKCCSKVSDVNSIMNKTSLELKSLQSQSATKMDASNLQSIEASMPNEMAGLGELFVKVQELQKHISSLDQTASQLLQDREERQANMNALLDQVELLKLCKVEREDVSAVLASKADETALLGKVSRDAFQMMCDDLTRGLQGTVSKLAEQEIALQQTLASIQTEMENKLDKLEMSPVKDFIQKRLQHLQDGFKRLMDMRKEALAAGTKQKFLRNVNCLSCDAQVVQATMEGPVVPTTRPLPVSYSMKAYLSYELDAMRKHHQGPAMQRNLHDWEEIERDMKQRKHAANTSVLRNAEEAHRCSRYCGGSHTMTATPQHMTYGSPYNRLHFGPDVLNLSSGIGNDGKVYRVSARGDDTKNVTKCSSDRPTSSIRSPVSRDLPHSEVRKKSFVGECTC